VAVPGDAGAESVTWRGPEGASGRSFLRAVIKPGGSYVNQRRSLAFPGGVTHVLHSFDTLTGGFRSREYLLTGLPAGQSVTLTLRSDAFDPVLKLLNADTGVVLNTSNTNTAGGNDETITFIPSAGVRYSAQVTTQAAGGTGEFTLAVFQPPAGLTTISGSQTKSGSLAITDPRDSFYPDGIYYSDDYLFTATTATPVLILMSSNSYDPSFSIINAETSQLLFAGTGREDNAAAMQAFQPRPGVPYIIRASSNVAEETGNYTLKTSAVTTIATGEQKSGSLSSTDGVDPDSAPDAFYYTDVFAFTPASSAAVSVFMSSGDFDTAFSLIDSRTGRFVGSGYGVDSDGIGMQTFVPVAGVTYFVRASSYQESVQGNYSLKVTATPSVTTGATINQQFSSSDGVDPYYAPDGAYYADDYILSGAVAGTPRTVTVTSSTVNVTVEILDAGSGETVAYNDDASQGVTNSSTTFTPQAGRSYIVRVSEFDELAVGAYVLKVQ
jgi:hypothetical protein